MNTLENNILIAEFMGLDVLYGNMVRHETAKTGIEDILTVTIMKYGSSWDWLIPVLRKVFKTMNGQEKYQLHHEIISDAHSDLSIVGTYDAVIEFIKYYNKS